jgi:hypothetical protein
MALPGGRRFTRTSSVFRREAMSTPMTATMTFL